MQHISKMNDYVMSVFLNRLKSQNQELKLFIKYYSKKNDLPSTLVLQLVLVEIKDIKAS